MKYVALLRGINIGGRNKISMAELKPCFEKIGFANVVTYINSGNVVFSGAGKAADIVSVIEKGVAAAFDLNIPILVRTATQIEAVLGLVEDNWQNNKDEKTDVMFLWEEYDNPEVVELLSPVRGIDIVRYTPGAVIWHLKKEKYGQSAMHKLIGKKIYKGMTVRNINTVRKLSELLKGEVI